VLRGAVRVTVWGVAAGGDTAATGHYFGAAPVTTDRLDQRRGSAAFLAFDLLCERLAAATQAPRDRGSASSCS
jgi:hypothetical protein